MSVLSKVTEFVGGDLFKQLKEGLLAYFPPDMSPQQKAELELQAERLFSEKQIEANKMLTEAAVQLDRRIAEQEGTAKDLLAMPVLGRLVLFLRGLQRPLWGFFTMAIDYLWFTAPSSKIVDGMVVQVYTDQQQTALIVINVLVLGFLFGERTIKNLEPLITKVFGNNNG